MAAPEHTDIPCAVNFTVKGETFEGTCTYVGYGLSGEGKDYRIEYIDADGSPCQGGFKDRHSVLIIVP